MPDKEKKPHFVIHIDSQKFEVDQPTMSGAQLKALVGKDASYQLYLEKTGKGDDELIADSASVTISNGLHFYTVPPATFGLR